jgi:hypothetical protein
MNQLIWDQDWQPLEWSQHKRRLARDENVYKLIIDWLKNDESLKGNIEEITPEPDLSRTSLFFRSKWRETNQEVLFKVGSTKDELTWAKTIEAIPEFSHITPKIFAYAEKLGNEEINWFTMEKIPFKLNKIGIDIDWDIVAFTIAEYQKLADKASDFNTFPLDLKTFKQFLQWGIEKDAPGPATRLFENLEKDWKWFDKHCPKTVQFGDVHFGNLYSRTENPQRGNIVLLDPIHRYGTWIFDPAYCQTIAVNEDINLIEKVGRVRKEMGLEIGDENAQERMNNLMLGWLSVMWWGLSPQRHKDKKWVEQNEEYVRRAAES